VVDWLWDVPEGRSAHENADPAKRPPSGYNTTYKRQVWHEPASTVQTTFGMISGCRNVHPIATRSLTIREAARIQSFPDSFLFQGSRGAIRKGIGNAVPPLLALALASHLRDRLFKGPPSTPAWHHPDARTSARMRRVHRTDTKPELVVRALLSRLGYRYRLHAAALPGRPDIVIPRLRCVVFVHGCFWHRHRCRAGRSFPASNVERWQIKFDLTRRRDRRHREALRRNGWRVLVLWECRLRDQERLTATLLKFLAAER
jgi:DNA mismatch endonuclease Vsr